MSGCCSSRQAAVNRQAELRINESVSLQSRDSVVVAVHDTILEITTIIVRENEAGDTLRLSRVTERDRISDRAQVKEKADRMRVERDTVYVALRDSTSVINSAGSMASARASPVVSGLRWVFWIIVSLIVLVCLIKVIGGFRLWQK